MNKSIFAISLTILIACSGGSPKNNDSGDTHVDPPYVPPPAISESYTQITSENLTINRKGHSMLLCTNGDVIVAGGEGSLGDEKFLRYSDGKFTKILPINEESRTWMPGILENPILIENGNVVFVFPSSYTVNTTVDTKVIPFVMLKRDTYSSKSTKSDKFLPWAYNVDYTGMPYWNFGGLPFAVGQTWKLVKTNNDTIRLAMTQGTSSINNFDIHVSLHGFTLPIMTAQTKGGNQYWIGGTLADNNSTSYNWSTFYGGINLIENPYEPTGYSYYATGAKQHYINPTESRREIWTDGSKLYIMSNLLLNQTIDLPVQVDTPYYEWISKTQLLIDGKIEVTFDGANAEVKLISNAKPLSGNAVRMQDGTVFVPSNDGNYIYSNQVYTATCIGSKVSGKSISLKDGKVLTVGNGAELYTPKNLWHALVSMRLGSTVTDISATEHVTSDNVYSNYDTKVYLYNGNDIPSGYEYEVELPYRLSLASKGAMEFTIKAATVTAFWNGNQRLTDDIKVNITKDGKAVTSLVFPFRYVAK